MVEGLNLECLQLTQKEGLPDVNRLHLPEY